MAAFANVDQSAQSRNSVTPKTLQIPRTGVLTLSGYGISVRMDRGHLLIEDGTGPDRHRARLPRVRHGLRRLVVIGSDGMVSLSALRWLSDQDAAFVMLERDGSVLAVTGPVRPSDARLRRAQALAEHTGAALVIAKELIRHKLAGQEQVAREKLLDEDAAAAISAFRAGLDSAESVVRVRQFEAQAAAAYWSAWQNLPITFPKKEAPLVPAHWRVFTARHSPLTGSPRLAADPLNAILNYLFAVLESEARLAAAALGLDPGLGFIHLDAPARDSLACDLMETVRPQIEAWVLDWITREPLTRRWFFEQRDGACRLMAELCVRLSQTAPMWGRAIAPHAEWVARTLWTARPRPASHSAPPTRLTQARKREAKGSQRKSKRPAPMPDSICQDCGATIPTGGQYCRSCAKDQATERMTEFGDAGRALGRVAAKSEKALQKISESRQRHATGLASWNPATQPDWLTEQFYRENIQPGLRSMGIAAIAKLVGVSKPYASEIRAGRVPHPRHWRPLAQLVGAAALVGLRKIGDLGPETSVLVCPLPRRAAVTAE